MNRRYPKRASRPMAVAEPRHVGRFAYSEYWRKWDEILDCGVSDLGRSWWQVRGVGEVDVRNHCTDIPEDRICDAPVVVDGRHRPPAAGPAAVTSPQVTSAVEA